MEVTVNLYGELRKHLAPGKKPPIGLRVPAGMAVRDVLDYLNVPADSPLSVVVNGEHHDRGDQLEATGGHCCMQTAACPTRCGPAQP